MKQCSECGKLLPDEAKVCMECGSDNLATVDDDILNTVKITPTGGLEPTQPVQPFSPPPFEPTPFEPAQPFPPAPSFEPMDAYGAPAPKKGMPAWLIALIAVVLVGVLGVGGWFAYDNFIKETDQDKIVGEWDVTLDGEEMTVYLLSELDMTEEDVTTETRQMVAKDYSIATYTFDEDGSYTNTPSREGYKTMLVDIYTVCFTAYAQQNGVDLNTLMSAAGHTSVESYVESYMQSSYDINGQGNATVDDYTLEDGIMHFDISGDRADYEFVDDDTVAMSNVESGSTGEIEEGVTYTLTRK